MLRTSVWILHQCQNVFQRTNWCNIGRTTCATRDWLCVEFRIIFWRDNMGLTTRPIEVDVDFHGRLSSNEPIAPQQVKFIPMICLGLVEVCNIWMLSGTNPQLVQASREGQTSESTNSWLWRDKRPEWHLSRQPRPCQQLVIAPCWTCTSTQMK